MSTPGEQPPSAEAKVASGDVEETVLTVKEKKEETEKAPISNFWVRPLQFSTIMHYLLMTAHPFPPNEARCVCSTRRTRLLSWVWSRRSNKT